MSDTVQDNDKLIDEYLLRNLRPDDSIWDDPRQTGRTNQELQALIGQTFHHAGASGPGMVAYATKGGKNPAFWLGTSAPLAKDKPTLAGMALVKRCRALLAIPQPDDLEVVQFTEEGEVVRDGEAPTEASITRTLGDLYRDTADRQNQPGGVMERVKSPTPSSPYTLAPLNLIKSNPYQPRQEMDRESIESLARGIKLKRETLPDTCGLMQVPIARPDGDGYQLAFGHRRRDAFRHLYATEVISSPWTKMPLQIVNLTDEEMADFAARENADREDLTDLDRAAGIKRLMDDFNWPLARAASAFGVAKSTGSNLVRLLDLPEAIKKYLKEKGEDGRPRLGQRHARELLRLTLRGLTDKAVELAGIIITNELAIQTVEQRVGAILQTHREHQALAEKIRGLTCFKCDSDKLEPTGRLVGQFKCTGCSAEWWSIQEFNTQKTIHEQDARPVTRYCPECGNEQTITGRVNRLNLTVTCTGCRTGTYASRWKAEKPDPAELGINQKAAPTPARQPDRLMTPCPRCGEVEVVSGPRPSETVRCEACGASWPWFAVFDREVREARERVERVTEEEPEALTCKGCNDKLMIQQDYGFDDFDRRSIDTYCPGCGKGWRYTGSKALGLELAYELKESPETQTETQVKEEQPEKLSARADPAIFKAQPCEDCGDPEFHWLDPETVKCANCGHTWTKLEWLHRHSPVGIESRSITRRNRLQDLRENFLRQLIYACPIDRLAELESWFEQLEAAFPEPTERALEAVSVFRENGRKRGEGESAEERQFIKVDI